MIGGLPQQHTYRVEVAHILVLGILINLLGSYALSTAVGLTPDAEHTLFSPSILFLDSGGTAFVAYLLGPWWAAAVGVLSHVFNSYRIDDSSVYVVVSVFLGIIWGYGFQLLRGSCEESEDTNELLGRNYPKLVLLCVIAALVATIVADSIKFILLPSAGVSLFAGHHENNYLAVQGIIDKYVDPQWSPQASLLTLNFYRNLIDKTLALGIGVCCAHFVGYRTIRPRGTSQPDQFKWTKSLNVGADSIVFFALVYAAYLLAARLVLHTVSLSGEPGSAVEDWMKAIGPILFSPFPIAMVAFVFFTFRPNDPIAREIDNERQSRIEFYRRTRQTPDISSSKLEKTEFYKLAQSNSIYGLMVIIIAWPAKAALGGQVGLVIYIALLLGLVFLFFQGNRKYQERMYLARKFQKCITSWRTRPAFSPLVIEQAFSLLKDCLAAKQSDPFAKKNLSYIVSSNIQKEGWLASIRETGKFDEILIVAPLSSSTFSMADARKVEKLLTRSGIDTVVVACTTLDSDALKSMINLTRNTTHEVIILDSTALVEISEHWTLELDPSIVFAKGRVRALKLNKCFEQAIQT